jgi:LPXTG-motif cell wall-anchored protein
MRNLGLVLIVLGILAIVFGLFGVGGARLGVNSLSLLGIILAVGGFLLYRRNRTKEVPGRS